MRPDKTKSSWLSMMHPIFFTVTIFLALTAAISAKSLTEYRKDVESAKSSTDTLLEYLDEPEDGAPDKTHISQALTEIKKNLPATEKIEWQGATVETDYSWLNRQLENFSNEKDFDKSLEILTGVSERLEALDVKLRELDNPAGAGPSKDQEKQKLSEILQRAEYKKNEPKPEEKSESIFQKWYREINEWIDSLFPEPNLKPGNETTFRGFSYILQILLYVLVAAVIGFVIYKFAPFFLQKYQGREKREKKDRVILGERIAADETPDDLFSEAEKMAREGNLREAIRKGYVALLCELSDRKIIGLAQHKTNRDYLRDVRQRREIFENMNNMTESFERHWYGSQTTGEEDWNDFRNKYQETTETITNFKLRITN